MDQFIGPGSTALSAIGRSGPAINPLAMLGDELNDHSQNHYRFPLAALE
jgi:hypothetical protein